MMFIEITQDGAGVLSKNSDVADGLFTGFVESCSIYVFYGTESFAIVHDTGQLKITSICDIAKKCGNISSAFYAVNPSFEKVAKKQFASHRERRERIKNILKLKRKISKFEIPSGKLLCLKDGRLLSDDSEILKFEAELARLPDLEIRKSVNTLNNLFLKKDSQSLEVDFQFDGVIYTPCPKLLKSYDVMTSEALAHLKNGDGDYLKLLNMAKDVGVFNSTAS